MKNAENEILKEFVDHDMELPLDLGKTASNQPFTIDLVKMPHILMGGTSEQESSTILNAIIKSLANKKNPSQLKFAFITSKNANLIELSTINKTYIFKTRDNNDLSYKDKPNSMSMLFAVIIEMDVRYEFLKKAQVRNIKEYNSKFNRKMLKSEKGHGYMPYIVVLIDEFATLITTHQKEFEFCVGRIVLLSRAVGIHLIINTQVLSSLVINDRIKSHFPARIAFKVTSTEESNILLDSPIANELHDTGEMLVLIEKRFKKIQYQ